MLALFPELHKELDAACKDALDKVTGPDFQYSKERVFIAQAFFNENPPLPESSRREVVALIRDAGNSKTLRTRLKDWGAPAGGSSWVSTIKAVFTTEGQASKIVDEAVRTSKDTKDSEFLAALLKMESKEPLLKQLIQDVLKDTDRHFQEFIERRLPRLYSRINDIKRQTIYRQVELGVGEQDEKRRASLRSDWFNGIKMAQAQVDSGCVLFYPQVH